MSEGAPHEPRSAPAAEKARPSGRVLAGFIVAAGILCWLIWSPLGANEVVGGDEGYYGVMALSMLVEPSFALSPPLTPLFGPELLTMSSKPSELKSPQIAP